MFQHRKRFHERTLKTGPIFPSQKPHKKGVLKILQINIRGIKANLAELREFMKTREPDLIFAQETWLNPGESFSIPGWKVLSRSDRNARGGGCMIIGRPGVDALEFRVWRGLCRSFQDVFC